MAGATDLELHEDRFFDPEPAVRGIARELYREVKDLPLVCPHGHVDPRLFAEDAPFPDPAELILIPDHYVFRMLHSQGIHLERLGIPTRDGTPVEGDHRKAWRIFAEHAHLFAGTPTGVWLAHEFHEVFGIRKKLCKDTADAVYDEIAEKLRQPEFRPRALYERFGIEVLTTTDGAADRLEHHRKIRESGWKGRVIPCFRPDALFRIDAPGWKHELEALEEAGGMSIHSFRRFLQAIEQRRAFFKEMGAVSTDHGVLTPFTQALEHTEAERIFQHALDERVNAAEAEAFQAHMLMESARMSVEDGMVMQLHPGSFRNHDPALFERFGPDKGADIPVRTEYTRNLRALLNTYGNAEGFILVLFTLDESTYTRELAPLAGYYSAVRLGPPWWFHDSPEGMMRYREGVTETAGIWNTAGFNDDTRALPSIPARHDLCRRVDCNFLARLAARHVIDIEEARVMARALAYDLVKKTYKLE